MHKTILTPLRLGQLATQGRYQLARHLHLLQTWVFNLLSQPGQAKGIVELPIRHGKSKFLSEFLPAWHLMRHPDREVILTGYGADFASEWGRRARNVFFHHAPELVNLKLDPKNCKAHHWGVLDHQGSMRTCGTLGPISGKTASLLISDDQVKDQAQANSPTHRDRVFDWFMSDALTRLEPDGKAIVCLSRRHPDDLVGRLHEQGDWQTLRLPAICDNENDPLGREQGDPLWPDKWPKDVLLKSRDKLELSGNSHIWSCLYQQNPTGDPAAKEWPDEYFANINTDTMPPRDKVRFRILALDPSKGKRVSVGDYSAFVVIDFTPDAHLYVQSHLRRIPLDKIEDEAVALLDELKPDGFIYESIGFQELIGANIIKKCAARSIPCPIWMFNSHDDKNVRIRLHLTPLLSGKRLHLDAHSQGNRLLLNQLKEFPTSVHDDGPDALTMGVYLLNQLMSGNKKAQNTVLRT